MLEDEHMASVKKRLYLATIGVNMFDMVAVVVAVVLLLLVLLQEVDVNQLVTNKVEGEREVEQSVEGGKEGQWRKRALTAQAQRRGRCEGRRRENVYNCPASFCSIV